MKVSIVVHSLSSISNLISATPPQSQTSHLLSLVYQRSLALLKLQATSYNLYESREDFESLLENYRIKVEDESKKIGISTSSGPSAGKQSSKDIELEFVSRLEEVIGEFEKDWERNSRVYKCWELIHSINPSTSTSTSSLSTASHQDDHSTPNCWLDQLELGGSETVVEVLRLLILDPYTLGIGIATLENESLTSLLSSPSNSDSPLKLLCQFLASARGSESVSELIVGIFESSIRELVGREVSEALEEDDSKGKSKERLGSRGAREKELEEFLVGTLELVDELGLEVDSSISSATSTSTSASTGTGLFSLGRNIEDILLSLLHESRELPRASSSTNISPTPSNQKSKPLPSTPWDNLTNTFSTIGTLSANSMINVATMSGKGLVGVANLGVGVAEVAGKSVIGVANVAGKGMVGVANVAIPGLFNSNSNSTSTSVSTPSIPASSTHSALPSSFRNPNRKNQIPSSPSRIISSNPSPLPSTLSSPLNSLLIKTSISLLQAFTPSPSSSSTKKPLLQVLIIRLLSQSFPLDSNLQQKVKLLFLVRFWSFNWLGQKLTHLATGGTHSTPIKSYGIHLSSGDSSSTSNTKTNKELGKRGTTALFDEIYLREKENLELMHGVHKIIYGAIIEACGLSVEKELKVEEVIGEAEREKKLLRRVAKDLITSLGAFKFKPNPSSMTTQESTSLNAFSISSTEFITLSNSFSQIIIHTPALGPTTSPSSSNPGRTSFKRGSSYNSTTTKSRDRSEASREVFSLSEKLERVLDDLRIVGSRNEEVALLFSTENGDTIVEVSRKLDLGGNISSTDSGWISPPRSPRCEAMQESMKPHPEDYFDGPPSSILSDSATTPLPKSNTLKWGKTKREEKKKLDPPSSTEISLLRRAVVSLIRAGYSGSTIFSSNANSMEELSVLLSSASNNTLAERDYPSHVLYSQSVSILKYYSQQPDYHSIIERIARPFLAAFESESSSLKLVQSRLGELENQYKNLLDSVRAERSALDDLRIRFWYESFVLSSELYQQLITRLAEVSANRTVEEIEDAKRNYEAWSNELGIFSFVKSNASTFEQSLQLVETFIAMTMSPERFYSSSIWRREGEIVKSLIASRSVSNIRPSFAETLLSTGSTILLAPLNLAGISNPTSTAPTSIVPTDIILSFGASSPSLLKPLEASKNFTGAIDEHLVRIGLKLAGLVWSDISTSLVSNKDLDGRLLGCDSWLEEFASPLSPLSRTNPSNSKYVKTNLPNVFQPQSPPPPTYCKELLLRFIHHPSPHAKMHALFELEVAITATLSAPISAFPTISSDKSRESITSSPRSLGYLSKLSGLLSKRMSLAVSPITVLLEGEVNDENDFDDQSSSAHFTKEPSILSNSATTFDIHQSPSRRPRALSSVASDHSIGSTNNEIHPLLLLQQNSSSSPILNNYRNNYSFSPSTDDLLAAFENILKHVRPKQLFSSLQIIASIIPASCDFGPLGKAFWDIALAALSVKKDIVESEFGLVDRAIGAMSEGTEESRELAIRLIKIAASEESQTAIDLLQSFA